MSLIMKANADVGRDVMKRLLSLIMLCALMVSGCGNSEVDNLTDEGVFYQIFVRAFADSDGDGIGDLKGITQNLDYLEELGISGIWLLPIHPSPSYHGYDVMDYYGINPDYGTIDDFKELTEEANKRGIKIVMDLVVNHASSEHPWFVDAKQNPGGEYEDYFVFADANDETYDFSVSPIDGKAWHQAGDRRYFGAFWDGMPDWNASNVAVRDEFKKIGEYWMDLGVNGFRLDAAKYMYAQGEYNTDLNLLQENLDFWTDITDAWRAHDEDVYIVSEVWSDATSVAPYYKNFDANFNFDLAESIISVVRSERDSRGFGLVKNLDRIYDSFEKHANGREIYDAVFLSNHDQNRIMSVFNEDEAMMKLAAEIYMMLPGNPYIYYGEELGMMGMKPDEDLRLPFKWGNEFDTTWRQDSYNQGVKTVDEQLVDESSLLNHYKELIALRNNSNALKAGDFLPVEFTKSFMIGHIRHTEDEAVLVMHNVSEKDCVVDIQIKEENVLYSSVAVDTNDLGVNVPSKSSMVITVPVEDLASYEQLNNEAK